MITTMMTTAASSAAAAAAAAAATVLFVASLRIADAGNSHTAQLAFTAQYVRANIVFRRAEMAPRIHVVDKLGQ